MWTLLVIESRGVKTREMGGRMKRAVREAVKLRLCGKGHGRRLGIMERSRGRIGDQSAQSIAHGNTRAPRAA